MLGGVLERPHTLCSRVRITPCVVELGLTGLTSTSQTIRTSFLTMLALVWSSVSVLSVRPHILYFSIKVFMVLFEKSTVRMAVFNGSVIIFFRIRIDMKTVKASPVIICTQIEFSPRLQKRVTSNTASPICSHLSGLLYKKYP